MRLGIGLVVGSLFSIMLIGSGLADEARPRVKHEIGRRTECDTWSVTNLPLFCEGTPRHPSGLQHRLPNA